MSPWISTSIPVRHNISSGHPLKRTTALSKDENSLQSLATRLRSGFSMGCSHLGLRLGEGLLDWPIRTYVWTEVNHALSYSWPPGGSACMRNNFGHTQMARQLCIMGLNQELLSNFLIVGNLQKFQLSAVWVLPGGYRCFHQWHIHACRTLSIFLRIQWNVGIHFLHVAGKNHGRRRSTPFQI